MTFDDACAPSWLKVVPKKKKKNAGAGGVGQAIIAESAV